MRVTRPADLKTQGLCSPVCSLAELLTRCIPQAESWYKCGFCDYLSRYAGFVVSHALSEHGKTVINVWVKQEHGVQ
jgi:hypothetical protein